MCAHAETLTRVLESVTDSGSPIYAPRTDADLAIIVEHALSCYGPVQ